MAVERMRAGWWHLFGVWRPSSFVKLLRIERRAKKYETLFSPETGEDREP
jgi:hypothetical protein